MKLLEKISQIKKILILDNQLIQLKKKLYQKEKDFLLKCFSYNKYSQLKKLELYKINFFTLM